MITPINILIAILWLGSVLIDYAGFAYLWQLKEYRWDRFRDFLSTAQGKRYWLQYIFFWRSLIAVVAFFWPFNDVLTLKYILIGTYSIDILRVGVQFLRKQGIPRPRLTQKAVLIIVTSLFLNALPIIILRDWSLPFLMLLLRFPIITVVVFLFRVPTSMVKKIHINRAKQKLARYPQLTIIGVTGSYGKSSVKIFLAHILSSSRRVLATTKNINTDIGVADYILKNDFDGIDIFIVEMGAYRIGEIQAICDMVRPQIGILTAINEQHLSLFGDIKNTQRAKYELLRSLPATGLAITNSDNPYCREYLSELTAPAQTFGYDEEWQPTCRITDIKQSTTLLVCDYALGSDTWHIETPLLGEHHAMNIAPCLLAARQLGMNREQIIRQVATLPTPLGKLQSYRYGETTVIDDSYNSNPEGFKAALGFLKTFPSSRRRIIITRGMVELGDQSENLHEAIGEEISFVADELIIISKDSAEALKRGVGTKFKTTVHLKEDPHELLAYVRSLKNQNCVILCENRLPAPVARELFPYEANQTL